MERPTIAVLIVLAGLVAASSAYADDPLPSWNDGAAKKSILAVHCPGDAGRFAGICATGRAHRCLRQRRHALGRAADAFPDVFRFRPGESPGAAASGMEDAGTIRLIAQR